VEDVDQDPASLRVGSVLDDKWTLERVLGSGGMGSVYAARHRNGARAAVKVLHPELGRRPDVRERFLREGYAANRVEHRGAVQVLDDDVITEGPDAGTAYLVMEMLEGESLEERLERGPPLTELELLPILNDVLAVLESAHEHGVVHRDLKPANLFLNKDPAGFGVKVLDFGLARLADSRSMTSAGLALGTPSFMAPEQANGKKDEIDARTDIFALGATAFSILSGRGVHEADGVLELVARMGTLPAPKLREVAPRVSERVARIVDRALEFKRDDRYPTAALMRADVQSALDELSPSVVSSAELAAATTSVRNEPTPSRGGSRALLVLGALVGAGLVLVLAVPHARDRALGEVLSATEVAASGSAGAGGGANAPPPDAATAENAPPGAVPLSVEVDAASDASTDAAESDASADDEEDDDELEIDASTSDAALAAVPKPPPPSGRPGAPRPPGAKHTPPKRAKGQKRPATAPPKHQKRH
jgi:serine/threonine-protein kinase